MVNFNEMHTQVFILWRKSHSLLDDPRNAFRWEIFGKDDFLNTVEAKDFLTWYVQYSVYK